MHYNDTINFSRAKFGIFVHWGLYSIPGGRWKGERMNYIGEWIQSRFRIPNTEYARLAERFDPCFFNAEDWVKAAKDAGMAYIVFTAKHHDGFAMYHSRVSRYNIVNATPFGRDVLRELAYACRKHDMKLGIYYSHCLDWHECDGADPGPDSPKNFGMSWGNNWDFPSTAEKDFSRYFKDKALPQVRELLTEYGPVFLLWFDCPLQITRAQSLELHSMIKSLQPDCFVNGRIGHGIGEFGSLGDNQLPTGKSKVPLESANTLNHTWGYKKDDHNWSDARKLLEGLLSCNEKDVNYLLNIGPRADGKFPEASLDILREVAKWRKRNHVTIQNTEVNPFPQAFHWGYCTSTGNVLQFFVFDDRHEINITGLRNRVKSCNMPFEQNGRDLHIKIPSEREDFLPVVVKLTTDGVPDVDQTLTMQDGVLTLTPGLGQVIHGSRQKTHNDDNCLGPAAESMAETESCYIGDNGSLTQWHHPGDGIAWEINIQDAGTYEIQVVTENRRHSAPWSGDRKVRLELAGHALEKELYEDIEISSSYYAKGISVIGKIVIAEAVHGVLKLINLKVEAKEVVNMDLTSVIIYHKIQKKD